MSYDCYIKVLVGIQDATEVQFKVKFCTLDPRLPDAWAITQAVCTPG